LIREVKKKRPVLGYKTALAILLLLALSIAVFMLIHDIREREIASRSRTKVGRGRRSGKASVS